MKNLLISFSFIAITTVFSSNVTHAQIIAVPQVKVGATSVGPSFTSNSTLLRNALVQEELKMEQAQKNKIQQFYNDINKWRKDQYAEARKLKGAERSDRYREISKEYVDKNVQLGKDQLAVLNKDQTARFQQIVLQSQGAAALAQDEIADKLQMAEEQRQQVIQFQQEGNEARMELAMEMRNRSIDHQTYREKMQEIKTKTEADLFDILTKNQMDQFNKLIGEKFEMKKGVAFEGVMIAPVPLPAPIPIKR